jgi:methionyl aminopeptidase
VGAIVPEIEALLARTQLALAKGIEKARAGNRLGDIGAAIERCVLDAGYTVVKEFVANTELRKGWQRTLVKGRHDLGD